MPTWTPSCARPSRSRCTPARRRRCSSACATRSAAAARGIDRRRLSLILGSFVPPAIVGYTLERPIERRLGRRRRSRSGSLLGSAAMGRRPRRAAAARATEAGLVDALALGLAQACALVPGASRNGMTLAAARLRGFHRDDANALSRHVALPVIVGATALKGVRLARRGVPAALAGAFAAGVGAAFVSTLASVRIIRAVERDRSFAPYAAYRPRSPRSCGDARPAESEDLLDDARAGAPRATPTPTSRAGAGGRPRAPRSSTRSARSRSRRPAARVRSGSAACRPRACPRGTRACTAPPPKTRVDHAVLLGVLEDRLGPDVAAVDLRHRLEAAAVERRGGCAGDLCHAWQNDADERRVRRRRRRHRPGRPRGRRPRRRPAHDRARPAVGLGRCPAGHYASVLRVAPNLGIAMSTDGVGSKLVVAEQADRLETVGHRLHRDERQRRRSASGPSRSRCSTTSPSSRPTRTRSRASPRAEGRRAGGGRRDPRRRAGRAARAHPRPPGPHGFDLCGTAFGTVALDAIVTGARGAPGDAIVGLPSSGLHSNGYTLARRALLDEGGLRSTTARPSSAAHGRRRAARADGHLRARGARPPALGHPGPRAGPHHRRRPAQPAAPRRRPAGLRVEDPLPVPPVLASSRAGAVMRERLEVAASADGRRRPSPTGGRPARPRRTRSPC